MLDFFYDTHCHLNDFSFTDKDVDNIVSEMKESRIKAMVVGYDLKTSKRAVELAEKYPDVLRAIVGVHPVSSEKSVSVFEEELISLTTNPVVVGIGECGFDYEHLDKTETFSLQKDLLEKQIDLAINIKKPLMFHIRSKKNEMDAYFDLIKVLEKRLDKGVKITGNVHFFAGDHDIAQKFFKLGITISFTGVVTYAGEYDELIKELSIDNFFLETDSPYVSPRPKRGQKNTPLNIEYIYQYISKIRKIDEGLLKNKLALNVKKQFGNW